MDILVLGVVYNRTDEVNVDENGFETPVYVPIDGYHVNTTGYLPNKETVSPTPKTPSCIYAGAQTYFYKFANEQAWLDYANSHYIDGRKIADMVS